jgi:oligopeptide/dipeptide ABC transporter ATP-binding protein
MSALLEVRDVVKRFPVGQGDGPRLRFWRKTHAPLLHAVDGVSFDLMAGESIGLVGESGCGKSTLARILSRLADPTGGTIGFDGADLARLPARAFAKTLHRAQIQMVFQDPTESLNPRYTAFDAIADPLRRMAHLGGAALRERVTALARDVGLPDELLPRFPHQLSGGQKARVGIARAIAVRPKLLVLDEPTSALDVSVQATVLHLLADLRAKLGMSYLFVSHDLNVVRLLCERVLVMYLGRIVEEGSAAEIFARPRHPYTQALVASLPDPSPERTPLRLTGEPRSPVDPDPHVCRFFGRCPRGESRCETEYPALRQIGESPGVTAHSVACHFA